MHVIILLITAWLSAQPAAAGKPAVPAHAEAQAFVLPNKETCVLAGEAIASQIKQDPRVNYVGFGCLETANPNDKPV